MCYLQSPFRRNPLVYSIRKNKERDQRDKLTENKKLFIEIEIVYVNM